MPPEEEIGYQNKKSLLKRSVSLLIKIAITAACFWYIATKIDFSAAMAAIGKANWSLLLAALLLFVLSKLLSAFRLNIYFDNIGLRLPSSINIRLYWLGMFYNLFLPGAISGDAYKVILLNRHYGASLKKTSAAVLLDRISGLLALGVILAAFGAFILTDPALDALLIAGAMIAIGGFYLALRFMFRDFLPGFLPTFFWGLGVQLCQVVAVYLIMSSLGIPLSQHAWVFIFLCSAIISVLPVSLGGGLGTRELVFAEGARFFHLDPQQGIVISILFYLITVAGSAWGLFYVFRSPLQGGAKERKDAETSVPR
ncbi:MAG TPA: lysylphosphatidylglycerol synthase transmembrane domain-containing protein [Flavisolibacter sp.]|nr:lysylphosphatidylglycerol synthase transmembrane domain-containing protein [Flavisolibacter sp.]